MTRYVAAVGEELGPIPGSVLGVGLVAAATSAARLLSTERPDAVVLVGTAGAFLGGPEIGMIIAGRLVGLGCPATTLGLGYIPRAPAPIECDVDLATRLSLPVATVLTNLAITTDTALANRFAADWQVEHMEAYAVAYACAEVGVPFIAVLGITNRVGPDAHAEWLRFRLSVGAAARTAALRLQ